MLAHVARRFRPAGPLPLARAGWAGGSASPPHAASPCACCPGPACRCGCRACAGGGVSAATTRPFASSAAASSSPTPAPSPEEAAVASKLAAAFPGCTSTVTDTSGGCGTMFQVSVAAPAFKGLATPRQHQAVAAALADDIRAWHGWTCETRAV